MTVMIMFLILVATVPFIILRWALQAHVHEDP